MIDEWKGVVKIISLKGVDGSETLNLQPGAPYRWALIDVWGYHDDTTANLTWTWVDVRETLTAPKATVTRLTNVLHPLYAQTHALLSVPYLENDFYLQLAADAIAAGKFLYIKAMVREWLA